MNANELLHALAGAPECKDGKREVADVQPFIAELLREYLEPRGYSVECPGQNGLDIGIRGPLGQLFGFAEVKCPSEPVDVREVATQVLKYWDENRSAVKVALATNGRSTRVFQHGKSVGDPATPELLEKAFPVQRDVAVRLTAEDLRRFVDDALAESSFFEVLAEKLAGGATETRPKGSRPTYDSDGKLPRDILSFEGCKLIAKHRGKNYSAVVRNGACIVDAEPYDSVSAAARSVTGTSVNGRTFWRLS